jgi:PAN domain
MQNDPNKELSELHSKYNSLLSEYNAIQASVQNYKSTVGTRLDKNNPYLGTTRKLPDIKSGTANTVPNLTGLGYGGYITQMGMFKPFPDYHTYTSSLGQNGCPASLNNNIVADKYSSTLLQGENMKIGQACGNEGSNVYVSSLNNSPSAIEVGCYDSNPNLVPPNNFNTPKTYDECMNYAASNGYKYFGLGSKMEDGTGLCVVQNTLPDGQPSSTKCTSGYNDKQYGDNTSTFIYSIQNPGNVSVLGKYGFVDANSTLHEYPNDMIQYTNDYKQVVNTDSKGNNLTTITSSSPEDCKTSCNSNSSCGGFTWWPQSNTCYLKTKAFPETSVNSNSVFFSRNKKINNSCQGRPLEEIDTNLWQAYIKGENMDSNGTQCNFTIENPEVTNKLNSLQSQMDDLTAQIIKKSAEVNTNNNLMSTSITDNNANILNMIKNVKEDFKTMDDVNSMLSDSDILVLQQNYSYIFWSIFAVGFMISTLSITNK